MSFELSVKTKPCIVIVDPCNAVPPQDDLTPENVAIQKEGYSLHRLLWSDAVSINLYVKITQRNTDLCYHIQHIMRTYQDEACVVQVAYYLLEKTLQVTINMYYDKYQAKRCSNCTTSYMKIYPLQNMNYASFYLESQVDKIISQKHEELSAGAETVSYNGSARQFVFMYNMTACVVDETFHIMISPKTRQRCTRHDLGTLRDTPELTYEGNLHQITG